VAEPIEDRLDRNKEERRIEYDLPEDLDVFDEFGRDLQPPGESSE